MSKITKNAIKRFYIAKKYKGERISLHKANELFSHERWRYCQRIAGSSTFKVLDVVLIEKDIYIEKFDIRHPPPCITGTLLMQIKKERVPWWELEEYGNTLDIGISKNIKEEHIRKNIKNRDGVIRYLNFVKRSYFALCQTQLKLPGFEGDS